MDITYGMSPFLPNKDGDALIERAFELAKKSSALSGRPEGTLQALRKTLSLINSYYSNLIEGQSTDPIDVDRAARAQMHSQPTDHKVLLALAVISTEEKMSDERRKHNWSVTDPSFLEWLHKSIYEGLPDEFLEVTDKDNELIGTVVPGQLRTREVVVGQLLPIHHEQIIGALDIFAREYSPQKLGDATGVLGAAASHHRLAWIHPFLDGNGRVARLFSHAYLTEVLGHQPLWSLSRGIARTRSEYYECLAGADTSRRGDFDGRGARSESGLSRFCQYFLDSCIDQTDFMAAVLNLDGYRKRVEGFVARGATGGLPGVPKLDTSMTAILCSLMAQGTLSRGEAARLTGYAERKARSVISTLLEIGLAESDSHVAPLRPGFPAEFLEDLFPKLGPAAEH